MRDVGIGLIGAGAIAKWHAIAFAQIPSAALLGVASSTEARARAIASQFSIPRWWTDYRDLVADPEIDIVCIATPNDLHREMVVVAAEHGKHVICEKPLARTLSDADEMIAACRAAGVKLMYAELVCFAPKYVRAKQLADDGHLGAVFLIRYAEHNLGPHTDWFWDPERSGGGALIDLGCHGIEICRWLLGKPKAESVTAELGTFVHGRRSRCDDYAISTIRFADNRLALVEASWAKHGGMDDKLEIVGTEGFTRADLLRGSSLLTYSAVAGAHDHAPGWDFTMFEEPWNYGVPQEMEHFVDCVMHDREPLESGEDGRAVLELIYAMYMSAREGRRVDLPLDLPPEIASRPPIACWLED